MNTAQLTFAVQIIAILSICLLAVGYLKAEPRAASARVFALIAILVVFYLLGGMAGAHIDPSFRLDLSSWRVIRETGATAIPGLFMIYCFIVFQEQQRFPRLVAVIYGLQVSADFAVRLARANQWQDADTLFIAASALAALQLMFAGFAIYWTIKGWQADLVEDRRIFRWFIISVQAVLIFVVVLVENFILDFSAMGFGPGQVIITYFIALVFLGTLLVAMNFDYVSLSRVVHRVIHSAEDSHYDDVMDLDEESFNRLFVGGKLYREYGLTIALLARRIDVPEYRVRRFIHKRLGFRNFSDMLHKYRVEAAADALADPKNRDLPITTIALSAGYQSLTPFNYAFRDIKGQTPSDYRRQAMARNET